MGLLTRIEVLTNLHNQTLRIDGLQSTFAGWPFVVNPAVDQVRRDVNARLTRLFPRHPKVWKLKAGDYGLFGASWWPCASAERLRVATYLSIWLFMWDDEIDSDVGRLSADLEMATEYRSDTLRFVKNRLGLDPPGVLVTTRNAVINSFDIIGDALREGCTIEQRERFMTEVLFFMQKSEVEQRLRLLEYVTTIEEFWQYRLGTSAVRVVLCLNEYCNNTDLPPDVVQDPDMGMLWDLTNINICNVNDLLSVKKEIAQGSVESLVPILYAECRSAQGATNQVMEMIRFSVKEFDVVARRLLQRFASDPFVAAPLQKFVDGCRYYCTGNLSWSLETGRYGVHQEMGLNHIYVKL